MWDWVVIRMLKRRQLKPSEMKTAMFTPKCSTRQCSPRCPALCKHPVQPSSVIITWGVRGWVTPTQEGVLPPILPPKLWEHFWREVDATASPPTTPDHWSIEGRAHGLWKAGPEASPSNLAKKICPQTRPHLKLWLLGLVWSLMPRADKNHLLPFQLWLWGTRLQRKRFD